MACGSCGTSSSGLPKGCNNNGACGTDGCGKLSVFDWLSNMKLPNGQQPFNFIEVRFKNDRKFYYKNENNISLNVGDVIAVEGTPGHDIGIVTLTGELVRIQMKKKNLSWEAEDTKKVYRKANQKDIETWQEFREREKQTMVDSRIMAKNLELEMKICDVEYQGDGSKVTFYYTAEGRVDFRQLIKEYAGKFGVRIEMKQIGFRQEAAKIGGIGSCGRELCCSTWLTDFRSVSTAAARYQQLSINSQKLAGQCGKLKCCLNFELDSYLDALNHFPSIESKFETEKGFAHCVKIDVFKKEMWFAYERGSVLWYKFSITDVQEFLKINEKGQKTEPLEELSKLIVDQKPTFDVIGEDSLERFERKEKPKRKRVKAKPTQNSNTANAAKSNIVEEKGANPNQAQKKNPNQRNNNNRKKNPNPNQNPNSNSNPNQQKAKPQSNQENGNATPVTEGQKSNSPKKKNPNQQRKNPNQQKPQQQQGSKPSPTAENKNTTPKTEQKTAEGEQKPKNKNKKRINRGPKPDNPKQ